MEVEAQPSGAQDKPYTFEGRVAYATEQEAVMVRNALAVDPELRPEAVSRELSVEGSTLVLRFAAIDVRTLRAAVGTFCDLLALATRTLEAFRPKPMQTEGERRMDAAALEKATWAATATAAVAAAVAPTLL